MISKNRGPNLNNKKNGDSRNLASWAAYLHNFQFLYAFRVYLAECVSKFGYCYLVIRQPSQWWFWCVMTQPRCIGLYVSHLQWSSPPPLPRHQCPCRWVTGEGAIPRCQYPPYHLRRQFRLQCTSHRLWAIMVSLTVHYFCHFTDARPLCS